MENVSHISLKCEIENHSSRGQEKKEIVFLLFAELFIVFAEGRNTSRLFKQIRTKDISFNFLAVLNLGAPWLQSSKLTN